MVAGLVLTNFQVQSDPTRLLPWAFLGFKTRHKPMTLLEHRAGIEPANTGFADQRVSHFATGAHVDIYEQTAYLNHQ